MKKRITIVLGILFVLMFSAVCVAEEEGCGDHTRNCDESVCFSCGVAYTGDSVRHDESYYEYSSNATYHWHECNACGKKTYDELHYAVCSDPKVCCCCGQPFTGTSPNHNIDFDKICFDENRHWFECVDCGAVENLSGHFNSCKNPDNCSECGAAYSGNVIHNTSTKSMGYDSNNHWYICVDCGEKQYVEAHVALCTNPDVCFVCKAPNTGSSITHTSSTNYYKYDSSNHWFECVDCGTKTREEAHWQSCTKLGVCEMCGVDFDGRIVHWHSEKMQKDEKSHWKTCIDCNEKLYVEDHSAPCTAPDACSACGTTTGTINVNHDPSGNYQYDVDNHWTVCNDCGQKITSSHKLSSGVCSICGAVPEDMVCKHENAAWEEVTAPECKKPGLKQQVCSECGEVIDEEEIPGLKHKFAKSVTKAGNCVEGSEFLFTCNLCGESYTEKKEPAGHIFENEVCTVCGEKWSFGDEAVYTFAEGVSIPETAKLTVTDCTDEYMADEVPEAIKHAEKVIRVALVDNESETALPGKVEIQLPCTEEILTKLENTMLMFLAENGELLEIQYRIENGMIIFSIEANGIYAFVPVES